MLTPPQKVWIVQCYSVGDVSMQHATENFNGEYHYVNVTPTALQKVDNPFETAESVLAHK